MTFTALTFPENAFPWYTGNLFLADPEIPLEGSDVLRKINRAGFIPAGRGEGDLVRQALSLQQNHPVVALNEHTEDDGVKKVLVYPLVGEGAHADISERQNPVFVPFDGKWEKHSRFLVIKPPSLWGRMVAFLKGLWPF